MKTKTKGQALTEFALILPLLLLLILGIIEGARIIWAYITVQNAAREAARYAVSGQPLDPSSGLPWTSPDPVRVAAIKDMAVQMSYGLGYTITRTQSTDYNPTAIDPGALGVAVNSWDAYGALQPDSPGDEGLNVQVQMYYNVVMLDPIYAIFVPNGYVQVRSETLMQNEGISAVLGSQAPKSLVTPAPAPTQVPNTNPALTVQGGYDWHAGDTINIVLSYHTPNNNPYQIFMCNPPPDTTCQSIGTVASDVGGLAVLSYVIPTDTPTGDYTLQSRKAVDDAFVADHTIHVSASLNPAVLLNTASLPAGSPLSIGLAGHPPTTTFQIKWGLQPTANTNIGSITTNSAGGAVVGSLVYTINQGSSAGTYLVTSGLATRTVQVVRGCIKVNQGDCGQTITVPAGVEIVILLQSHAANHAYQVQFNGVAVPGSPVTTSPVGEAFLTYLIPATTPNGTYTIRSLDGTALIATVQVKVVTPSTPFIYLPGYTWPAGSSVDYQLRKHEANTRYDIYWEGTKIVTGTLTDAYGTANLNYTIPITTSGATTYTLASYLSSDHTLTAESADITVIAQPYLVIEEGNLQVPGNTIHIDLRNHRGNTQYTLYVQGNPIPNGTVTTDVSGAASVVYVIPASLTCPSNVCTVESRRGGDVVAATNLNLSKPDLRVQSIVLPANLTFNQDIPITVTIINSSLVTITNQSFDVDVYLDPVQTPDLGRSLPPGIVKVWLQPPLAISGTRTFTTTIPLYGAYDHHLWVRADTSNRVVESDELNNMSGVPIYPTTCAIQYTIGSVSWTGKAFGDASTSASAYTAVGTNTMNITADGQSVWGSSDDSSGNGYYYVYHQATGNFDVRVRAVSQSGLSGSYPPALSGSAGFGLEVRADATGAADKIDWFTTKATNLQSIWRTGGSVDSDTAGSSDLPAWLRIVRTGSQFLLYYAYSANNPPNESEWQLHRTINASSLPSTLLLGLFNASFRTDNRTTTVQFDNYRLCGDPGQGTLCGEVREAAGQVILSPVNYTAVVPRSGQTWAATTRSGEIGMAVPNAGSSYTSNPTTTAPELRYSADFTNLGTYYVWVLGYAPDSNSDTLYFGLDGSPQAGYLRLSSTGVLTWFNSASGGTNTLAVASGGPHTINLWAREDGLEVYQILLTTDSTFDPRALANPLGLAQSQCSSSGSIVLPPGLQQCDQVIENGRFEDTDQMPLWHYAGIDEQVTRTTQPHYAAPGESYSMNLPAWAVGGIPRQPWLYQEFLMPSWVITPTTGGGTSMNLTLHTGVNQRGASNPDPLYVALRTQSGGITLTQQITLATGADLPELTGTTSDNAGWVQATRELANGAGGMMAAGNNPVPYANQTLQLYFYSPNPSGSYSTDFYLDNVELNICTAEPRPATYGTLVKGNVRVFLNGAPTPQPGVYVWIYAIDGSMAKTYTIQDSSYSFYDLPATSSGTRYIVYAEYWDADDNLYSASTTIILRAGQTVTGVDLLLF